MSNPLATIGSPERMCQSPGISSATPLDLNAVFLPGPPPNAIPYPFTPTPGESLSQALANEQAEFDFAVVQYLIGWSVTNSGQEPTGASSGPHNVLQGIANKTGVIFQYTLAGDKAPVVYSPGAYFPGE